MFNVLQKIRINHILKQNGYIKLNNQWVYEFTNALGLKVKKPVCCQWRALDLIGFPINKIPKWVEHCGASSAKGGKHYDIY